MNEQKVIYTDPQARIITLENEVRQLKKDQDKHGRQLVRLRLAIQSHSLLIQAVTEMTGANPRLLEVSELITQASDIIESAVSATNDH